MSSSSLPPVPTSLTQGGRTLVVRGYTTPGLREVSPVPDSVTRVRYEDCAFFPIPMKVGLEEVQVLNSSASQVNYDSFDVMTRIMRVLSPNVRISASPRIPNRDLARPFSVPGIAQRVLGYSDGGDVSNFARAMTTEARAWTLDDSLVSIVGRRAFPFAASAFRIVELDPPSVNEFLAVCTAETTMRTYDSVEDAADQFEAGMYRELFEYSGGSQAGSIITQHAYRPFEDMFLRRGGLLGDHTYREGPGRYFDPVTNLEASCVRMYVAGLKGDLPLGFGGGVAVVDGEYIEPLSDDFVEYMPRFRTVSAAPIPDAERAEIQNRYSSHFGVVFVRNRVTDAWGLPHI